MNSKGSITVFFSLILTIILALVSTLILSAKVAAGRAFIAISTDTAMYSVLARYDRELFESYHVFFLNGGYETGSLQPGEVLSELESDLSYLLSPKKEKEWLWGTEFLRLEPESGAITGYTLATDENDRVFKEQAVQYIKDTLGITGVSSLMEKLTGEKELVQNQLNTKNQLDNGVSIEDYENMQKEADDKVQSGEQALPEQTTEEKTGALEAAKAAGTIAVLKKTSLLNLLVPDKNTLSGWSRPQSYNRSTGNSGMGLIEISPDVDNMTSNMLFMEYLIQTLNSYGEKNQEAGPAYGLEYLLYGKDSDIKNLEAAVNRLMLIREGANMLHLYTDPTKKAKVQSAALLLSTVLLHPEASQLLEAILIAGWAFVESLVDLRGLLDGGQVPLIKTAANWQVEFSDIPKALGGLDGFRKSNTGVDYTDYLRILLFMTSSQKQVDGCMEVIELTMQAMDGKKNFSLNQCIDLLEVEINVKSESRKSFSIIQRNGYRMLSSTNKGGV